MLYVVTRSCLWAEDYQFADNVTRVIGVCSSHEEAVQLAENDLYADNSDGFTLVWDESNPRLGWVTHEDDEEYSCNDCYEITKVAYVPSNT